VVGEPLYLPGVQDEAGTRPGGWRHLPALLVGVGCLAPFVFVLTGSVRAPGPPPPGVDLLPWPLSLRNYPDAFALVGLPHQIVNSLVVAAVAVPLGVLVASTAGFGLARLPRAPRRVVAGIAVGAAMIPTTALVVGRFSLFRALGVTDTLLPLMAPALLGESPFHVLFYLWSFRRISPEVFDAARLEGLSEFGVWWRVALPMVRPITIAVAVSSFVDLWGNYLEPLVYLSDPDLFTVPMGLGMLARLDPTNQPLLLAGAAAAMAPVLALFLLVQRHFFAEVRS
jgi:multiple sugar transport system permease protein